MTLEYRVQLGPSRADFGHLDSQWTTSKSAYLLQRASSFEELSCYTLLAFWETMIS